MKKTISVFVGMLMLLMLPGVSFSDDNNATMNATTSTMTKGPYLSSQLGVTLMPDSDMKDPSGTGSIEFKPGGVVNFAGGYNFGMFRVEGEIGYQINEIDKVNACSGGTCVSGVSASGNRSALSFLGNFYIDFVNSSPVTPYISGGIGIARIDVKDFAVLGKRIGDADDTVFAYQVGAGVAFAINKHMAIDVKYRYFATSDLDLGTTKVTFASHNIYGGFRYTF